MKRRIPRRSLGLVLASAVAVVAHEALAAAMAHGHVAHVLLGASSSAPPLGAACLAVALVVARLVAVVLVPGMLAAAAVGLLAHHLSGSYSIGISDDGGAGTSIGGRGTE